MSTTSSVTTNLDDYAPDATAVITATGVDAGSTVRFEVDHVNDPGADGVFGTADDVVAELGGAGHDAWYVTDGGAGDLDGTANGTIITTWYVNPDDSAGERFLLTASTLSGWFASHTFTDAKPVTGQGTPANPNNAGQALIEPFLVSSTAGTGVIQSIVKIGSNDVFEQGYNSDFRDVQFNETTAANFNRSITLAEIPVVEIDGIAYREFDLDLNEDNGGSNPLITLQTLMIFASDTNLLTGFDADSKTFPEGTATLLFDMDKLADISVLLTDWNSGSGTGDYAFFIPVIGVGDLPGFTTLSQGTYIYIYSEFGTVDGQGAGVSGGFEEWFVVSAPNPSMQIEKFATIEGDVANAAGDVINYTLLVSNVGNVHLTGVTVSDPYADPGSIQRESDAVGDNDNILEIGEVWSYTATHTVTQAEMDNNGGDDGLLDNTATADSNETDPVTDTASIPVLQLPAMTIDKAFVSVTGGNGNDVADAAGDVLNYTVTVTNTGNVTLTGVTVVDPLTGQNISDVTLAPGDSQVFATSYTLTQDDLDDNGGDDGDIDNTATADSNETDESSDSETVPLVYAPAMTIDKAFVSVTGGNGNDVADAAGDVLNYTVTVTNTGNVTLTGVTVVDPLTGQNISDVTLAPGDSQVFATSYTLTQDDLDDNGGDDGDIDNTATADSNETDESSDSETVPLVYAPAMTIDKAFVSVTGGNGNDVADAAGDVLNYTVTVTNTGNVTLTGVTVVDPLTGQNISDVTLAPGASQVFATSYTLTQDDLDDNGGDDGDIDNTATADSNETDESSDSETVPLVYAPAMTIDKAFVSVTGGNGNDVADAAGDVLNYTVTVTNTGNVTLTGVTVVDPLTGQNISDVTLAPGASQEFATSYTLTQDDLDDNGGDDGDIDNTATTDSNETDESSDSETVPLVYAPAMTIDKAFVSVTGGNGNDVADAAGDVLNYTVTVTNTGNVTLTGVTVVDPLTGQNISDVTLAPGASQVFATSYTLTQDDLDDNGGDDGDIDNTATTDSNETDESSDSETVPLVYAPAMTIDKAFVSVTGGNGNDVADAAGDVLNYTVTVTNTGNVTLTGVTVVDPLTGQNISDVTLAPGASQVFATSYTLTQDDLDDNGGDDGDIDNTATADSNETDESSDSETVPLVLNPGINIDKVTVYGTTSGDGLTGITVGDSIGWLYTVTNTGNIALPNVTVVDDHGTVDTSDDFSPAYIEGDDDSDGLLDVNETWIYSASGSAVLGTYTNIATVFAFGHGADGGPVTDTDDSSYTAIGREALIAPTGTTPYQYISGMAQTFQEYYDYQGGVIQYSVKGGKINQTNPGVFFYFTGASGDIHGTDTNNNDIADDPLTVKIDQTMTPDGTTSAFSPLNFSNVQMYKVLDDGDGVVDGDDGLMTMSAKSYQVSVVDGDVFVTFTPTDTTSMYIISVKYQTATVVGNVVTMSGGVYPTVNYQFDTVIGGSIVETYAGGVDLAPKPNSMMLLADEGGDGARAINPNQMKVLVDAAIAWWAAQGEDVTALKNASVELADLGQDGDDRWILGMTDGDTITIDDDGAGLGWSTGVGGVARNKVDMLSVLVHEMGHVLGMTDDEMGDMLAVGDRMMPANGGDDDGVDVAASLPDPAALLGAIGIQHAEQHVNFS